MRAKYVDMQISPQTVKALFEYVFGSENFWLSKYCLSECPRMCAKCIELAKQRAGTEDGDHMSSRDTICWCCKHSVEGCTTKDVEKLLGAKVEHNKHGTKVIECPRFERG